MKREEIWKFINGYENIFMISNFGRVKSLDRYIECKNGKMFHVKEKILKPTKDKDGYRTINLYYKQTIKACKIHRLVAEHFIPNPNNLPEVNHKDEDKSNNYVDNLEWCDRKYNVNYYIKNNQEKFYNQIHNARKNISLNKKVEVYKYGEYVKTFNSVKECSEELNVDRHRIADSALRGVKNRQGYIFKYIDE